MGGVCVCPVKKHDDLEIIVKPLSEMETAQNEIIINNEIIVSKSRGTPLEKYQIKKLLGEGSFGKVYLVRHKETGIERAMKEIVKDNNSNEKEIENEIAILKKLDHPNIVKIYEFFTKGNRFYLITEFCKFGELFEEINKNNSFFEESHVAFIMYQLLISLNYCHKNNILHRDLKPENMLIEGRDKNGFLIIKVIDFGTAKIFNKNENEKKMIGSAYYIAPEVINKNYKEKCDLWSSGVIMYILLTGQPPFNGKDDNEIFKNIQNQELKINNNNLLVDRCQEVKDFMSKLLIRDPQKRLSAEDALNDPFFVKFKTKENFVGSEKISLFINNLKSYKSDYKLQQAAIAIIVHNIPHDDEIKELERAFRLIDENGDGRLTKEEVINGFMKILNKNEDEAKKEVDRMFLSVDADKSGFIEYEEFIRACINKETLLNDSYLKFAFSFFDKDGSGQITVNEIKEVFCGGNANVSNKLIEKLIAKIDTDGDGQVSFAEFKKMMRQILI